MNLKQVSKDVMAYGSSYKFKNSNEKISEVSQQCLCDGVLFYAAAGIIRRTPPCLFDWEFSSLTVTACNFALQNGCFIHLFLCIYLFISFEVTTPFSC